MGIDRRQDRDRWNRPTIPIRSRKRDTHLNSCVKSRIFALAQIFSAAFSVCAAGLRLPFTSFFRSAVLFMSTRRLSPAAIAKERENCFVSPLSIQRVRRIAHGGRRDRLCERFFRSADLLDGQRPAGSGSVRAARCRKFTPLDRLFAQRTRTRRATPMSSG